MKLEDYQLCVWYYSLIKWKQWGDTKFWGDETSIDYIKKIGLNDFFDEIDYVPAVKDIDTKIFWAASKILMYDKLSVGDYFVDIDAILKDEPVIEKDLGIAHFDSPDVFLMDYQYSFPKKYILKDYETFGTIASYNASFLIFNNKFLKDTYCKRAIEFMTNNQVKRDYDGWQHMVYAEQVLLKQISENYKLNVQEYFNHDFNNPNYYHTGYSKKLMSDLDKQRKIRDVFQRLNQIDKINLQTILNKNT
jgi:hypothetical protein